MHQSLILKIYKTLSQRFGLASEKIDQGVGQRLAAALQKLHINTYEEFLVHLNSDDSNMLGTLLATCIPQETSFFRDIFPFVTLKDLMLGRAPAPIDITAKRPIRIWSVGCASGQEPISIAMLIHEICRNPGFGAKPQDFSILATDINRDSLAKATEGLYSASDVARGLSEERRKQFFRPPFSDRDGDWQVADELRKMVVFQHMNLMNDQLPPTLFQLIFCRNVLIYYNHSVKQRIIAKMADRLADGGLLFLGNADGTSVEHPSLSVTFDQGTFYLSKKSAA